MTTTYVSHDLLAPSNSIYGRVLSGSGIVLIVLLLWAAFSKIDEVAFAQGKVVPAGEIKTVQNLEGGIVETIEIKIGQQVKVGDVLVRINNEQFAADLGESAQRLFGLEAMLARLNAETTGRALVFTEELLHKAPEFAKREMELFKSRQLTLRGSIDSMDDQIKKLIAEQDEIQKQTTFLTDNIQLLQEEIKLSSELVATGAVSRVDLLKLERQRNESNANIQNAKLKESSNHNQLSVLTRERNERRDSFFSDAVAQRNQIESERQELLEKNKANSDRVLRTEVRSPVNGTVNRIYVNTIGGVIRPGMSLVEIVPKEDSLVVEAKVKPEDIAFITPGQRAVVRLSAYDYAVYGILEGQVETIGADTIAEPDGAQFYQIRVRTQSNTLKRGDKQLPVLPGMVANVDIITGKRSVLDYLIRPTMRTLERAFKEN